VRNTRRALLLFAIVLGVSAIVAAAFHPQESTRRSRQQPEAPPRSQPRPAPRQARIDFEAGGPVRRRALPVGRAAAVFVTVPRAGQVELPALGLAAPAEPLTPASFQVIPERPGDYEVLFAPAGGEPRRVGVLVVRR
jgi:hypothetical protein